MLTYFIGKVGRDTDQLDPEVAAMDKQALAELNSDALKSKLRDALIEFKGRIGELTDRHGAKAKGHVSQHCTFAKQSSSTDASDFRSSSSRSSSMSLQEVPWRLMKAMINQWVASQHSSSSCPFHPLRRGT